MKVLIADDDPVSCRLLAAELQRWNFETISVSNGLQAWKYLAEPDHPHLALLDWMMPEMDGLEVCQKIRQQPSGPFPTYVILLTGRAEKADIVAGLQAGADDYLTKPFDRAELRARLQVGARLLGLQQTLTERVLELEEALRNVKQLQGLLPICSWCKKIRDDQNYWQRVEDYITTRSDAQVTHGICPECLDVQMGRPRTEGEQQKPND